MITFLSALVILVGGYFTYGVFVEKVFAVEPNRVTPARERADGVDYVPLGWHKIFLIQLLNIAGLGPIFGALAGALWGPVAFFWIVFGCILGGATHDYLAGMISLRHNGASLSELVGVYLGPYIKHGTRVFTVFLLILVGAVFMTGPAKLLASLTPAPMNTNFWLVTIIIYYFLATMLPIDKLIGRIYPLFGLALLIMAVGIVTGLFMQGHAIPEVTLANLHPSGLPIWPLMFISIACGAISGFHATQAPMMARCLTTEKHGRRVFYGAMIAEGVIALIWAAAGMAFYQGTPGLAEALKTAGPGGVVHTISTTLMGSVGGVLAMVGVVVCPITSGDTAFRSARLTIADALRLDQKAIVPRLWLSLPLLAIGVGISQINFDVIWRYFAWANQTLAVLTLWTAAVYLARHKRLHWIASLPATFMSAVCMTYVLQAPEGLRLPMYISGPVGWVTAAVLMVLFLRHVYGRQAGRC